MRLLILAVYIFTSFSVFGQYELSKFGEISTEELNLASYQEDTLAKAVILFDKGKSFFFDTENGYDIRFTRHKRLKIFQNTNSSLAEVSIPFYNDRSSSRKELVKSIEAITYNYENGVLRPSKLDPTTIYTETINENWKVKKFVFPNVQDGSILELKYVFETPFHFNLPDWNFQSRIPTMYSEYQVSMIPFYEYAMIAQGIKQFDTYYSAIAEKERQWGIVSMSMGKNIGSGVKFQDKVHTYGMRNIPAFKNESYISSINDYIQKLNFQLARVRTPLGISNDIITTWPELNKSLLKNDYFGKFIKSCSKQAKKIIYANPEIQNLSGAKKAEFIISLVKNTFTWDGRSSKYTQQKARDFIRSKRGNSAEINLFLISILREADIQADPIVISTRDHGKIKAQYPFSNFLNYVIVLVHTDSPFLSDGTEPQLPFNKIPIRCLNGKGLLVDEDKKSSWVDLLPARPSFEKNSIQLTLDSISGNLETAVSIQSLNYKAYQNRRLFMNDPEKITDYYSDQIGEVSQVKTNAYERTKSPYIIVCVGSYETEKLGESIVIKPFLDLPLKENVLIEESRTYPVDFIFPWEKQFDSNIKIPPSYTISDLPELFEIENELVHIKLEYIIMDGSLRSIGKYEFKKAIYDPIYYKKLKNYFEEISKRFNEVIVIEQKE